jgi:hypothetical protein
MDFVFVGTAERHLEGNKRNWGKCAKGSGVIGVSVGEKKVDGGDEGHRRVKTSFYLLRK